MEQEDYMKYQVRRFGLAQLFFHISALLPLLSLPLGGAFAEPPQTLGRVINRDHGGRLAVAVRNAVPGEYPFRPPSMSGAGHIITT
jgi:hypothetical protein